MSDDIRLPFLLRHRRYTDSILYMFSRSDDVNDSDYNSSGRNETEFYGHRCSVVVRTVIVDTTVKTIPSDACAF